MALPTSVPPPASLPLDHSGPWTEDEFMALPEGSRVELLDGTLIMSARGNLRHQLLGLALSQRFRMARTPDWRVVGEFDVRVGRDRVFIPDMCVLRRDAIGLDDKIADAADVALVVEIASPSTVMLDRHVKTRAYAEAGIPRLLRVEFRSGEPVAELSVLDDGAYVLGQRAEPGETLRVDEPFPVELDLAALLEEA